MLASSHHGPWRGPNRLWLEDPVLPERSDGTIEAEATLLTYRWSFRGAPQHGRLELAGPLAALRAAWTDTWHAKDGMALHGCGDAGCLTLYGTYPAGESIEWGWRIELDARDPEHLTLCMYNVQPGAAPTLAVELRGARAA
jgi:hypothetical protein